MVFCGQKNSPLLEILICSVTTILYTMFNPFMAKFSNALYSGTEKRLY